METIKQTVHCCNNQCIKHTSKHLFFMKSKLKQQQIHVSRVVTVTKNYETQIMYKQRKPPYI